MQIVRPIRRPVVRTVSWWPFLTGSLCLTLTVSLAAAEVAPGDVAFYENEIRPLLVKHCHECHGDSEDREGELSLTSVAAMMRGGASGPAVVKGQPKESLLVQALEYRGIEMPPNGKLPQNEIDKIVRWVRMGMPAPEETDSSALRKPSSGEQFITEEDRSHWAFQPIFVSSPPNVDDPDWNSNPIDRFLFREMQQRQIEPNGMADRATLLRRATYDLTGLPPTPREVHEYLSDDSSDAWEKVIERLLSSPRYGERWGRHWLDVVRYADTAGDASDYPVPDAYKYRNYVINSFNSDKPYDQFLREQIAGDLLAADAPREQYEELVTATTFLAISRRFGYNDTNFQYFHLTIQDLLDTLGQSVMGLSIGCARCHDHKFEPISAKDYYALYGIFSSTKFAFPGAEEVRHPKGLVPAIHPEEVQQLELSRQDRIARLDQKIQERIFPILNLQGDFESSEDFPATWKRDAEARVVANSSSPFHNVFPPGTQSVQLPNDSRNLGIRRAIETQTADTETPLFINMDFRNISSDQSGEGYYRIALDHPENNFSPAVELFINESSVAARQSEQLTQIAPLESGVWYNLQIVVHWREKQFSGVLTDGTHSWPFKNLPFNSGWDGVVNSWVVDGHGTDATLTRPLRELDNFYAQDHPFLPAAERASLQKVSPQEQLNLQIPVLKELQDEKAALLEQKLYPTIYGVQEGIPANAQIQFRGEPDRRGEEVPRGFLEILGGDTLPANCKESGRRELAEWLTSSTNPLTARVMVNRIWQAHFGRGIVATPNDLGLRGERPSHPELLDYLSSQFLDHGYSIKSVHRMILSSRAYRLSSEVNPRSLSTDPANVWFWRHERQRLDAESIRDSWLFLSGELDLRAGGAHPIPPVSQWTYSQHVPFEAVYDSNLRSIFLMTQRIKGHPFLALFDGADPNATTGKRDTTTTPSQALFMMNNEFLAQRSIALAERLLQAVSTQPEQIIHLYEQAYARRPSDTEVEQALEFLQAYGENVSDSSSRSKEALAAFVRVVLCSNEFLHVN